LLKHSTDFGGNDFAKMGKIFVSAASYVDEQRFARRWLRLFTHYMFHPYRGIQFDLDYLTHYLPESNGFNRVLIVVDHLTRMAHFMPCT
jgi:hypothetical protein